LNEQSPERVILHVDMNSYFATVEQQANPLLRGKPIAVGGSPLTRTIVAAASIEAKKYGVKSGMSLHEALQLCPHIILVEGDGEKYMYITQRFLTILENYTPLLEFFSIDEAFLDLTNTHERFGGPLSIALEIKRRLREELGEWLRCSIGIGPSKLIAKLASEIKKPDGLVMVRKAEIPGLIERMKLSDLCGIGKRMERRLVNLGIDTVAKLRRAPVNFLTEHFGIMGLVLHKMSMGEDSSPVLPYYEVPPVKSMGHHYTLAKDTYDMEVVQRILLRLSEQVARRLRNDHYRGKTVTLTIRAHDLLFFSRQRTLKEYIDDGYRIFQEAMDIMRSLALYGPIRLVGVSVSNLAHDYRQLPLFLKERKSYLLTRTIDRLNDRYGEFTVKRAAIMNTRIRRRTGGFKGII
jgi:DNA polymerase IV